MLDAYANRVADAVVARLQQVGRSKDPSKWQTDVKGGAKRGMLVGDVMGPLPAFFVQVGPWEGRREHLGPEQRTSARIYIHCVSGDVGDGALAEVILNGMAEDAIRAIRLDDRFDGLVFYSGLDISYRPDGEATQRSGKGIATVDVDFFWEYPITTL